MKFSTNIFSQNDLDWNLCKYKTGDASRLWYYLVDTVDPVTFL